MIHIVVASFFTAALLGALVTIHLTVRLHWAEILAALKGDYGRVSRQAHSRPQAVPALRRHAAF